MRGRNGLVHCRIAKTLAARGRKGRPAGTTPNAGDRSCTTQRVTNVAFGMS